MTLFRSLYAKLSLLLVGLLVSVGLLYVLLSTSATQHYFQEVTQHFNRDLARNLVADRNLVEQGRLNQKKLKETFHQYMLINPSIEIYLLDLKGKILAFSAEPDKVKRRSVALGPIRAFLQGDEYPVLGEDPRSHAGRKAFSVTPVPSVLEPEGYLYVVLRGEKYAAAEEMIRESFFLRMSAWAVAGSLVFGLLAGLLLLRLLTRRLQRLSTTMDDFQTSNFNRYTPYASSRSARPDEIDRLGLTFDGMATRIKSQFDKLQENDALRRELVAHVSHDLRTPLASLHGYLESLIIRGDELSARQQAEYLRIALSYSETLGKLVAELFELAKLDARETEPQCEPFMPAELVQDVVQKYRLQAEQRGVQISVAPLAEHQFVAADIALTERVLDNLLGNALEHTPSGGMIRISFKNQDHSVMVKVTDTGRGIPKKDLQLVFEPFHRGGHEERAPGHAGLGLAIARRIVELHKGHIRVDSMPGRGTVFSFTLPVWEQGV